MDLVNDKSPSFLTNFGLTRCSEKYFAFECLHDFSVYHQWSVDRPLLPVVAVTLYLMAIYYGQKWMQDRKPLELKSILFLWNASLALFSIMGTIRVCEDVFHVMNRVGFHPSLCLTNADRVRGFWVFAFMMSKFVELGDTFFLVVRKRNLMFLHWYHHVTVLLFTWYAVVSQSSAGRYFIAMNFLVHSLMYSYFALQTLNIKAPLFVSMSITTLQILQMVGGIYVIVYTRMMLLAKEPCTQTWTVVNSGLVMYGSYFLLFVQFFVKAYILKGKKRAPVSGKIEGSNVSVNEIVRDKRGSLSGLAQSIKKDVMMVTKMIVYTTCTRTISRAFRYILYGFLLTIMLLLFKNQTKKHDLQLMF